MLNYYRKEMMQMDADLRDVLNRYYYDATVCDLRHLSKTGQGDLPQAFIDELLGVLVAGAGLQRFAETGEGACYLKGYAYMLRSEKNAALIFDSKNAMKNIQNRDNIEVL